MAKQAGKHAKSLASTSGGSAMPSAQPALGEKTKRQKPRGVGGLATIGCQTSFTKGFSRPPAATFSTYRRMQANPTIAIAMMAAMAPIKATPWAIECDDDAPPQAEDILDKHLVGDPLRVAVRDMCRGICFGFAPFEVVWDTCQIVDDETGMSRPYIVPVKIKPLLVDITEVMIDKTTEHFAGYRQGNVDVDRAKAMHWVHDGEADNLYGRSRHENVRTTVWPAWDDLLKRTGQYTNKVAGVIPIIRYPQGKTKGRGGVEMQAHQLAEELLQNLGKGSGVTFPHEFTSHMSDLARAGVDPELLYAWSITFLEPKNAHGNDFDVLFRRFDAYLLRGWLVTERSVTEGQYGTKAEAETHGNWVMLSAEEVVKDMAVELNHSVVDPFIRMNFGAQHVGKVRLVPAAIDEAHRSLITEVVKGLFTDQLTAPALMKVVDVNSMLDQAGVPMVKQAEYGPPTNIPAPIPGQPGSVYGGPGVPPVASVLPGGPGVAPTASLPTGGVPVPPPATTTDPVTGQPIAGPVADTALNGAQVTAAVDIVVKIGTGEITPASAKAMLMNFFKLDDGQAQAIIADAKPNSLPLPPPGNNPFNPGGGPPSGGGGKPFSLSDQVAQTYRKFSRGLKKTG